MTVRTPEKLRINGEEYLRRRVFATEAAAVAWRDMLRGMDFLAETQPFSDEGETVHAVYVRNPKGLEWKLIDTYTKGHDRVS